LHGRAACQAFQAVAVIGADAGKSVVAGGAGKLDVPGFGMICATVRGPVDQQPDTYPGADRHIAERVDTLAAAEHERLVRSCQRPLALSRRVARPLGRTLFNLGAWLLRYGKDERTTELRTYRASARSIKLN